MGGEIGTFAHLYPETFMKIEAKATLPKRKPTDLLVLLLDKERELSQTSDAALGQLLEQLSQDYGKGRIKRDYFSASPSEVARHVLVQHTGLVKSYDLAEKVKILAARALDQARDLDLAQVTFLLNGKDAPEFVGAVAEGVALGGYRFDKYRKEKDSFGKKVGVTLWVAGAGLKECRANLDRTVLISECVNDARQLVNEPGAAVYPEVVADLATEMGREHGLEVSVLDEDGLRKAKHAGLLCVGSGSIHPPRLVSLEYRPARHSEVRLALVGKGITFDTGGISLKPGDRMLEMKGDMAGSAAVLYAMKAIARLQPDINVLGVIPTAENMPDARAQRPGDIFVPRNGKSVQVDNTDAEGRLVLIDGFERAGEWRATHIVDIATLTGAVVRALGTGYAGIMGNDSRLTRALIDCGRSQGEMLWELPLPEEYRELLKTPYADVNNIGGRYAGAITAGLFLQEFVPEDAAWAHLDIAGPFLSGKAWKYYQAGATGFGLKTFVELCRRFPGAIPE